MVDRATAGQRGGEGRRVRVGAIACLAVLAIGAIAAAGCGSDESASGATNGLETIEPGVLTVAVQPYMPYTGVEGGELDGLDSEILEAVAERLDLEIRPQVTDFNGMLGGVQSRRVDISIGGIAWAEDREKQGLFTDPPYYSPPAVAASSGETLSTIADLEGLNLGTVTGYVWVDSIEAIPGAELNAYPNATGVFDDLGAGRIDGGFLDPLLITYTQERRPDLGLEIQYLEPPTDQEVEERPDYEYLRPYMTGFYLPEEASNLEEAITKEIRAMYESGEMAELIEKWGGDPEKFLTPSAWMADLRRGVDRPQSWEPPSI
jgi:polar amino acid transport system substrate-binding protein